MFARRSIFTVASRVGAGIASSGRPQTESVWEKGAELKDEAKETVKNVAEGAQNTAKAAAKNPLLPVGFGLATAIVGYTVFCYAGSSKDKPEDVSIAESSRRKQQDSQKRGRDDNSKPQDFERRDNTGSRNDTISSKLDGNSKMHGLNRSDADQRRINAAGSVGSGDRPAWKEGDQYDGKSTEPLSWHTKEHADKLHRTDRRDAESEENPEFLADRAESKVQGFRRVSRKAGNEEHNTAASPNEAKRDLHQRNPPRESRDRVYADERDMSRADKLSLDGGAKASRDGQAMSDHAKKISALP